MKTIIIYHDDLDGRAAAAIAAAAISGNKQFIAAQYGRQLPTITSEHIIVIVLDYTPPAGIAPTLWIDHHKSAAALVTDLSKTTVVVFDTSQAACVLAWRHFFPEMPVPPAITLIGERDTQGAEKAAPEANYLMQALYIENTAPDSDIWHNLFTQDIARFLETGKTIDKYQKAVCARIAERAYVAKWDQWRILAVCAAGFGSATLSDRASQFDFVAVYSHDGHNFTVSLYSGAADVDLGALARQFGGGGHKGAAGFTCKTLPWV